MGKRINGTLTIVYHTNLVVVKKYYSVHCFWKNDSRIDAGNSLQLAKERQMKRRTAKAKSASMIKCES
jgi:hypothetical protein